MRLCLGPWKVIPKCISYEQPLCQASPCSIALRLARAAQRWRRQQHSADSAPFPLPAVRLRSGLRGPRAFRACGWATRARRARALRGRLVEERRLLAALPRRRVIRAQLQAHLQQTIRAPADLGPAACWAPSGTTGPLPAARRRLGHAAWRRSDGALRAATPVIAAPGRQPRFGEKSGKETPHPDRAGETSASAAGVRRAAAPAAPRPSAPAGGWPAQGRLSPDRLPRGHGPSTSPSALPSCSGASCHSAGELFGASSNCAWQSHSASYRYGLKILWNGYYMPTFLRSNSLGQYIL